MPTLTLRRRVEIAGQLTVRSGAYFDAFEFYQNRSTRRAIAAELGEYYWFFKYQMHVHRLAFILKMSGLFSRLKSTPTVNFPMLVDELQTKMKRVEWEALRDLVNSSSGTARKIEIIRNKALAHRSADVDFDDAFRAAKVTRGELKHLLATALRLSNDMALAVGAPPVALHSAETKRDMRRLFEALGSRFSEKKDWLDEVLDA